MMTNLDLSACSRANRQLIRHTEILKAVNRLGCEDLHDNEQVSLLIRCAEILLFHSDYPAVLAGECSQIAPGLADVHLVFREQPGSEGSAVERKKISLPNIHTDQVTTVFKGGSPVITPLTEPDQSLPSVEQLQRVRYSSCWSLSHKSRNYGVLIVYCESEQGFTEHDLEFLESTIADFSLALYACDISRQLRFERDFNTEIIDTIQALMVSITPCGNISRFNPEAEKITGYTQAEAVDRYWVDILLHPDSRSHYQVIISNLLKQNRRNINFQLPLLSKTGETHTIDWHSSIKPDIENGTVGMVLFGLDVTDKLEADKAYTTAVEKWENIFATIQDPALIVSESGEIIDANHATFSASRKSREEVIGQSVCKILHSTRAREHECSLLPLLKTGKSRILHTTLHGLRGEFLLTLCPLTRSIASEKAILLVARDMTEEERLQAEAIRASQLASLGELAAGVAHEINNPINGILNYAQMLADLNLEQAGKDITHRIMAESRRIENIVRNLLDFSRHSIVDNPEPVDVQELLLSCIDLVKHQLQKEEIRVKTRFSPSLPLAFCNGSQIKQVILNTISNSRYALNQKFKKGDSQKKISLKTDLIDRRNTPFVRISITDFGTGIEPHILEKVFDPFYSTKPNGEGTGLGLSISYGLVRDNGGHIRISSERNRFTTIKLDLPVVGGASHGKL